MNAIDNDYGDEDYKEDYRDDIDASAKNSKLIFQKPLNLNFSGPNFIYQLQQKEISIFLCRKRSSDG